MQLLLIAFALRGFNQEWNVEVEVGGGESDEERQAREAREERARRAREQRAQTAMPWELQQQKEQELRDEQQRPGRQPTPAGLATLDPPTRRCWNWHTGQAQNLLPLGACGFESHPPH